MIIWHESKNREGSNSYCTSLISIWIRIAFTSSFSFLEEACFCDFMLHQQISCIIFEFINLFFQNFFIKNESYHIIYIFKNYFFIMFSDFSKINSIQTIINLIWWRLKYIHVYICDYLAYKFGGFIRTQKLLVIIIIQVFLCHHFFRG